MRTASLARETRETRIEVSVDLDGGGVYDVATGIGFLDHMLEQLSRHSLIDLRVRAPDLITVLPRVTWPSPAMTVVPPLRTERIVVPSSA